MPIEATIDHEHRLVLARAHGVLDDRELFDYQRSVWSRPSVAGYDELVDLTDVKEIGSVSSDRARQLAEVAARADPPDHSSRFAIVATTDLTFGLARMYATYRELQERGTKEVRVFRTRDEALTWLTPARV